MLTKIKEIAEIQIGYQSRGQVELDPASKFRIIQIKDFDKIHRLSIKGLSSFKPDRDPQRYFVSNGDVLFLSRGQRNFAWANTNDFNNTVAASYFYILRLKATDVLPEYVAWYLNQPLSQVVFKSQIRGSHIPIITKSDFEDLMLDIPSVSIQQSIINIEGLLSQENELILKIMEMRQELIHGICSKKIREIDR